VDAFAVGPQAESREDVNDEGNGDAYSVNLKPAPCVSHPLSIPKSESDQELIKVHQSPPTSYSKGILQKPEQTFAERDMMKVHSCSVCQKLVIGKYLS